MGTGYVPEEVGDKEYMDGILAWPGSWGWEWCERKKGKIKDLQRVIGFAGLVGHEFTVGESG